MTKRCTRVDLLCVFLNNQIFPYNNLKLINCFYVSYNSHLSYCKVFALKITLKRKLYKLQKDIKKKPNTIKIFLCKSSEKY